MKHLALISLSFFGFLAFLFLVTSNTVNGQNEFKEFKSERIGIKLQIPSQYTVLDFSDTEKCFVDKIDCSMLMYNDDTYLSGNLSFSSGIQKYSFNGSLKDFLTTRYNILKTVSGFSFLDDKEIKFKNNPSWQMEYIDSPDLYPIFKHMSIFTKVNNTFYELSYTVKEPDFSKYLPEAQSVLNSIEFLSHKPPEVKEPSFLD